MVRFASVALALVIVTAGSAAADARLVLEDGQVLTGTALERKQDLYFLSLETGGVLPVPVELVRELRLSGGTQLEPRDVPTGIVAGSPQTLAGPPGAAALPRHTEQREALGPAATFARGPIDSRWTPTSDWTLDPSQNQFNPARWFKAPIDPTWHPISAFRASEDVTNFNPARWFDAPVESTWWPTDGLSERNRIFRDFWRAR